MRGSLVALMALAIPEVARADPKDDARRHFAAGLEAARAGDYEFALERFLAAQEAWPHPSSLYNIAKSYLDLGDLPQALRYYRMYQAVEPENGIDVAPIIATLEARVGQPAEPTPIEQAPPIRPEAGAPTADEIGRLGAIAQEIQQITRALEARASTAADPPEPVEAPPPAPAAEPEAGEEAFLEEAYERVVITASRVGQDPLDSPSTVSVLTADDIRLSGVLNVPDLLRRVVGVEVMSPAAGHSDIAIRGFQRELNNKVLILVDGRSTYLDFLGTTFWGAIQIELEEIERIEVIRGPGSAVYGANAVTGVINLITRTPGEGPQVFTASVGSPGITRLSGVATGRVGLNTYRLSAGYEHHGRWARELEIEDRASSAVSPWFESDDTGLETLKVNGRVDRTLGSWGAVSVSGGLSDNRNEFSNIGALPNYGMTLGARYLRGDLFVEDVHVRGFWNQTSGVTGPWLQYPGERSLDGEFDNDIVDLEIEVPLAFETGPVEHRFNAGGGWRYKAIRFSYLEGGFDWPYVENHFQGYVNDQATLGRLGLAGSLRVDAHPLIPISRTVSPRGSVLVRLFEKTSLRATAGSAYRAPTALESYMAFDLPTPADGVFIEDLGNQALRPERITTVEIGIHDESSYLHTADVAIYMNRVTDLIGLSDVTPAFNPFDSDDVGFEVGRTGWINLPGASTGLGAEAELELFPTDGLDLFANASISRITEEIEGGVTVDGSSSPLKINAGASYRTPYRTDVSLSLHYLSAQDWGIRTFDPETLEIEVVSNPLPARLLPSARIAVRPFEKEDFEVAIDAWNFTGILSDGFLEHPEGQPITGRLYGSVGWRF